MTVGHRTGKTRKKGNAGADFRRRHNAPVSLLHPNVSFTGFLGARCKFADVGASRRSSRSGTSVFLCCQLFL
jgi:hypothetical protein